MDRLTLKQLRYVDALARHGHFGHAAEACAVTQPALSMQIKELEAALGITLFERGPRAVRLTGFGEDFITRARAILRDIDELLDLSRAAGSSLIGRLRIGVIPTIAPYLLPRIMPRLAAQALDIHLRETMTANLLSELKDGRLDTAILALPVNEADLEETPLFSEEFVLVRPAKERLEPTPAPEDLREMRLLLLEEGHCFRDQALSFCNMRPGTRELMDGSSLSTLVQMVSAGIGVTLIPEMALPVETRSAEVAIARFGAPAPERQIGMIWRRSNPLAERLTEIAQIVREAGLTARAEQATAYPEAASRHHTMDPRQHP